MQQAKPAFALPDLCDELSPPLRIAEPLFTNYGGNSSFYGEVVTVACFEDNSMVKQMVREPGHGKVMVVNGRGSLNKALLGDMLAEQAVKNGWHGFVINGCVRDVDILKQLPIGIKALAAAPQKTEKLGKGEINQNVQFA
ncbi:ribonuclease E activity regulator RraA [Pseudobowmanella zhangzhouensis]